jgi:hypothetical protein
MESQIEKYKLKGRLFVWKFHPENRNYLGWNLTGDNEGCNSLIELLELMQTSSFPSHNTITTQPATINQVKATTGSIPFKSISKLNLRFRKGEPQLWYIEEVDNGIQVTFGEREIELLQTALQRIIKGEGDFALGDSKDEHLVYFWWFLEDK